MKKRLLASIVIAASLTAITGSGWAAYSLEKERQAWTCGKQDGEKFYIFRSGDEYVSAYPDQSSPVNSYLISTLDQLVPKRWRRENQKNLRASSEGYEFTTISSEGDSNWEIKVSFVASSGLLLNRTINTKDAPSTVQCKSTPWSNAEEKVQGKLTGAPLNYLINRRKQLEFLNPKLGNPDFNKELASALIESPNSEYSVYKLLSSLDRNKMTTEQLDAMDQAKKKLLSSTSQEVTLWEHGGKFTYYPDNESEDSARQRCNAISESLYQYTSDGYEIVSSNPENKPMGRRLECQGTFYLLKKEGYID